MTTDEKILLALERIEKRLEGTATKEDIRRVEQKVDTVELKVAVIHDQNKKDHSQIIDMLVESNESNYHELKKDLKKLEKRIDELDTHLHTHKN